MAKIQFIGYIPKDCTVDEMFEWNRRDYDPNTTLETDFGIYRYKRKKSDWIKESWPPKKVIITIEEV